MDTTVLYIVIGLGLIIIFSLFKKMIKFAIFLAVLVILGIVIYKLILTI